MKALPIRWKLALWTAGLVGVVVLAFAGAAFLDVYHEELEAIDLELEATSMHIAGLRASAFQQSSLDELVRYELYMSVAVFDERGQLVRRSPKLPEEIARAALAHPAIATARGGADRTWRVVSFKQGTSTVAVAYSLEEVQEIIDYLQVAFAFAMSVVLVLATFGGWWVSGRALGGLRDFTTAAESIRADQLHRRLPVPEARDEIHRLADVLNTMLADLEKSFDQSRRFSADASHELRTPLTIIGGEITRLLRTPNLPPEAEAMAVSIQEEVGRLQRITEQMLLLARFDSASSGEPTAPLDFSQLVRLACDDAELLASAAGRTLSASIPDGIQVRGDESHLRRLVLNLLDNAIRYSEPGGSVACTLSVRGGTASLAVGNSGPGIPDEVRPGLFQRFYRGDAARTRGGHGLGLSLSREIARAHGGDVELARSQRPNWTEFIATLPLLSGSAPSAAPASAARAG